MGARESARWARERLHSSPISTRRARATYRSGRLRTRRKSLHSGMSGPYAAGATSALTSRPPGPIRRQTRSSRLARSRSRLAGRGAVLRAGSTRAIAAYLPHCAGCLGSSRAGSWIASFRGRPLGTRVALLPQVCRRFSTRRPQRLPARSALPPQVGLRPERSSR